MPLKGGRDHQGGYGGVNNPRPAAPQYGSAAADHPPTNYESHAMRGPQGGAGGGYKAGEGGKAAANLGRGERGGPTEVNSLQRRVAELEGALGRERAARETEAAKLAFLVRGHRQRN